MPTRNSGNWKPGRFGNTIDWLRGMKAKNSFFKADYSLSEREVLFHQLLEYQKTVFYICLGYAPDYSQAEELAQEIYLKAWARIGTIKHCLNLKAWLFTLARNTCLDYLRKEKIRKLFLLDLMARQPQEINVRHNTPEQSMVLKEDHLRLKKAIRILPEKLRQVIILKEYGECSCQQIATLLGVKLGTVHSRLNRAKARVMKKLRGSHEK